MRVALIFAVMVAGPPLTGQPAPEVVAWGAETSVPSGLTNVVALADGGSHSLALTAERRVVPWGSDFAGLNNVPTGLSNVVAIAASPYGFNLALTAEGRVVTWGVPTNVPPSGLANVVAIATQGLHSLAPTADGRVVAWGWNAYGQTNVPGGLSNVVAIAAGDVHSLALTANGQLVAWGASWSGQTDVPSGLSNVVAIAAGDWLSLALTAEGRVVAWGANDSGLTNVPSGLSNVVAIAAGGLHSLALTGLPVGMAAPAWVGPRFLVATADFPFHHRIAVKNGATSYGAVGLPVGLELDSATGWITGQPAQPGKYQVLLSATNSVGASTWTVTLFVNEPAAPGFPGGLAEAGLNMPFSYALVAYNAPEGYGASGLPAGLVLDPQTGVISGAPLVEGEFVVSLVATNRYGLGRGLLTLRVSPLAAWGWGGNNNDAGELRPVSIPGGLSNVVAITGGGGDPDPSSLALTADGQVLRWDALYDRTEVYRNLGNVVAIAAGYYRSLALTSEGRVVAFGHSWDPVGVPGDVPAGLGNVVAIAEGVSHRLALTLDGRVVAWGSQRNVPSGLSNVVAIAAGVEHNLALTAEGRVVAWGSYYNGMDFCPMTVPNGLSNVVAIAVDKSWDSWGYSSYNLVLTGSPPGIAAPAIIGPRLLVATADKPFYHRIVAKNGVDAYGATGLPPGLVLDSLTGVISGQPQKAGRYEMVLSATNSVGSGTYTATLFVNAPGVPVFASRGLVEVWVGCEFSYPLVASEAPERYEASGLPPGLALDAQSGVISGIPTQSGDFVVNLSAVNRHGVGSGLLTLRVSPVVAWGAYTYYATFASGWVPATLPGGLSNVVAIAAGGGHSLALTAEGRVVAWGANSSGQTDVPSGLRNVVGIAAGGSHSLALLAQPTVATPRLALSRGLSDLEFQAHGAPGISGTLLRADQLPGPWLPAAPVTFTNAVQSLPTPDLSAPAQFYRLLRK